MTVVEGKIHPMFFERHRVILGRALDDLDLFDADLVPARDAGCPLVLAYPSADDDR